MLSAGPVVLVGWLVSWKFGGVRCAEHNGFVRETWIPKGDQGVEPSSQEAGSGSEMAVGVSPRCNEGGLQSANNTGTRKGMFPLRR
jgi:hypothetical protein